MKLGWDTVIAQNYETFGKDAIELFSCCRKGDLRRIKYLVEQREIELNVRDKWDGTPLYYACLCGHKDVVEYLLNNGARCVSNTFDGERCHYASLNTEIRALLRDRKVITSSKMRRDGYDQFLTKCLEDAEHCDVTFIVQGEEVPAHRCILSARSSFFRDAFLDKWKGRSLIPVTHALVDASAFRVMLKYLYTGRLEMQMKQFESLSELSTRCGLTSLITQLRQVLSDALSQGAGHPSRICSDSKMVLVEPDRYMEQLQREFGELARLALPAGFDARAWTDKEGSPLSPEASFADICFSVEGHRFFCHKVFFCNRSEYFRALVQDHFAKAVRFVEDGTPQFPVIPLHHVTAEVFARIVQHVYGDSVALQLTPSNAWDVLCAADVYLLPDLKRQCSSFLGQQLEVGSVCAALTVSRLFALPRLEDRCIEFLSRHLDQVVGLKEFREVVMEDAREVKLRQETDSISVIDDIRYHISANARSFIEAAEASRKLGLIDDLLSSLGLEA